MDGAPGISQLPPLLYGTAWKEERTEALVTSALHAGFRGIDTANQRKHYFEAAVGRAVQSFIASRIVRREELFLQTKFTFEGSQDHRLPYDPRAPVATQVRQSFDGSLAHFATDYLDSFVLHGPSTPRGLQAVDVEAWRAMESLASAGRTHFIGISNVTASQLRELLAIARVKPRFVQNRCHASRGWDRDVRGLCAAEGLVYQGFSLLTANRRELAHDDVARLCHRTGRSVAELIFRFAVAVGMLPLTGTSDPAHMRLDLGALDLEMVPADVQMLERLAG
jgi:diketogulonate reductase-like aldo/keto reductase